MTFYRLSRLICTIDFITQTLQKFRKWMLSHDGDPHDSTTTYFINQMGAIAKEHQQRGTAITKMNVLMLKYALMNIPPVENKPIFNSFETVLIVALMIDSDQINELALDRGFAREFIAMPIREENF